MKGRRSPTALKILEGNKGKRPIKPEPMPQKGVPQMPAHFTGDAARMWANVAPELDRLGLLTVVDGAALEAICTAYARAVKADRVIEEKGLTFAINGMEYQRPEIAISSNAWKQVRSFCTEFGLTPASRGKLAVGDTDKHIDALESALCG